MRANQYVGHPLAPPSFDPTARLIRRWERVSTAALTVLVFLMASSSFYYLFVTGDREALLGNKTASQNPIYMLMWAALYGLSGLMFLWSVLTRGIRPCIVAALPLVLLVLISAVWSVNPKTTLFYGFMFSMNALVAYTLSQMVHPARLIRLLGLTLLFCLMASYPMWYLMPDVASNVRWGGGWVYGIQLRGVFAHKSDAGYYFAILFLIMLAGRWFGISWRLRLFGMTAALLTMPLTNSATGVVALIVMAGLLLVTERMPRLQPLVIGSVAAIAALVSVVLPFIDLGGVPQLLGRDEGLTGRGDIWEAGKHFVAVRPIFGYGYYGFFDRDTFSPVWDLWGRSQYFFTPHFHNAAMDVTISLGILGLALYVVMLCFAFMVMLNETLAAPTRVVLALILLAFVISAAFDFTFMKHNNLATFLLFYTFFAAQTRYTPAHLSGSSAQRRGVVHR
ncbi:MAG: hypothetical protein GC150_02775 [Rhizobiales bacterium]|nr:hypothetical protein [Hyphomicrobiales bacterium]